MKIPPITQPRPFTPAAAARGLVSLQLPEGRGCVLRSGGGLFQRMLTVTSPSPALHMPYRFSSSNLVTGGVTMRLTERVLNAYHKEARRTGSYIIARQYVMAKYRLTARRFDQMMRMVGER